LVWRAAKQDLVALEICRYTIILIWDISMKTFRSRLTSAARGRLAPIPGDVCGVKRLGQTAGLREAAQQIPVNYWEDMGFVVSLRREVQPR
jgi:hypothetical protein